MSLQAITATPQQFSAFIASENEKWDQIVKVSGARAE